MTKKVKEIKDIFECLGVEIEEVERTIRHYKFHVRKGTHKRFFTSAATPSDHRAMMNFRGDVKRWLKSIGEHAK
jgi:hypothetical protein